jgi:hypothetical protein
MRLCSLMEMPLLLLLPLLVDHTLYQQLLPL